MKTLASDRDRAEILRRLRAVRADSAARWGRMSAHQMVCHVSDGFRMAAGHKPVRHSARLLERTLLKWMVLYLPRRWPAGITTSPEIDQEVGGTRPIDFAADVAQLEALVGLATQTGTGGWQRHPFFGRMSEADWLRWGYLHADHHLRQFGV
jgi:hypothetical protein